jgi:oligopeptidase B
MKNRIALMLTSLVAAAALAQQPAPQAAPKQPFTVKSPHGDRVDEYHWLRDDDPKAKRPEIIKHLEAENAYTDAVLAPLAPLRAKLLAELRARVKEDDSAPPQFNGGFWYWTEFKTGQEYPLLMRQRGSPEKPDSRAPKQLLLDQNQRAAGKPYFAVGSTAVSPDGQVLAWTEDTAGRRQYTLRFRNLSTGQEYSDGIPGVLESLAWANDSRTLFYIRQDPVTLQSGPVWRHRLGTKADDDVMVYDEPDKTQFVDIGNSASRRYIIISIGGFDSTETRVVDADHPTRAVQIMLARRAKVRHTADHLDGRWVVQTNEDAPNFKLVAAAQQKPDDRSRWQTLIAGREQATLERFVLFKGGIAVQERVKADSRVRLLQGGRSVPMPVAEASTVTLASNRDARAAWLRYTVTSMVQPQATWDWHLANGKAVLRKTREVPTYDASLYRTQRFWAPARDGQQIPVTLAWRADKAKQDGSAPLMLIGYGSYGASYDATFSSTRASLMDRGFVVAILHVRGGADLGEGWYEAGRLMNKKNTFNDFVDATQALVKAQWGDGKKVFASGGSAGGLLMGVIANEAPQLYRGIVLDVPFVDVVTTMLDETIPLTANEWTQWGDPRQKAAYDYMLSYSPYDNLRAQAYPAMLVTTGLWDSQVQYFEPAKYVARLRTKKTDTNPLLLAVNMTAGHGGASGRFAALAEIAREYAFVLDLVGQRE